jgi:ubiquinone/menaquinone biosynthesis C-methylase UbiE
MANQELIVENPFEDEQTSIEYSKADPVYETSARAAVEFVNPLEHGGAEGIVLDIGAGTGVSSEMILKAGVKNLYVIDPAEAMLKQARERLGEDKVKYLKLSAEDLLEEFSANVDLAYALNTFHLFADMSKFLAAIACTLKPNGVFVFNISAPTFGFTTMTEDERLTLEANKQFYTKLNEKVTSENEIIRYTIALIDQILGNNFDNIYTKEKIEMIFSAVGMSLASYKEILIKVSPDYQQNIWSMIARSFISDEATIQNIINSVTLPKEVNIRQAIFKLINN